MTYRYGLRPVIQKDTRVVVLGSMPSNQSIQLQQYYGHPRNHFWYIMEAVFQQPFVTLSYQDRLDHLTARGIGLWDVIASCERQGSADQRIKNEQFNPLEKLANQLDNLQALALNGKKAADSLHKWEKTYGKIAAERARLPSSSPVPGKNVKSFDEKTILWRDFFRRYVEIGRPQ